jgi:hypothetical protein
MDLSITVCALQLFLRNSTKQEVEKTNTSVSIGWQLASFKLYC